MKRALALLLGAAFLLTGAVYAATHTESVIEVANAVQVFQPPKPVTLLAFGDLMLDRAVRTKIDTQGAGYLFDGIEPWFAGRDIIVANAEGVFSDNPSISVVSTSTLVFTFATSSLPLLKQLGFTALSQANNHALNFGWDTLTESKASMQAAGIDPFGDPDNKNPGPLYETVRGTTVALIGYDQFASDGGTSSSTLAAIAAAKAQGAFIIIYPHWGVEYNTGTTTLQTVLAHKFVDAGADAVLGDHPHVVEPIEIYKGKAIFYSMGNFIFDQPWSDTREGLGIGLSITDQTVAYTLVPFEISLMQPAPMQGALRSTFLLGLSQSVSVDDAQTRSGIAQGSFTLPR